MNLDQIRKMSDDELRRFLRQISSKNASQCGICQSGSAIYTIYVNNRRLGQQKKLCNICENCYKLFLEKLNVSDIMWE